MHQGAWAPEGSSTPNSLFPDTQTELHRWEESGLISRSDALAAKQVLVAWPELIQPRSCSLLVMAVMGRVWLTAFIGFYSESTGRTTFSVAPVHQRSSHPQVSIFPSSENIVSMSCT